MPSLSALAWLELPPPRAAGVEETVIVLVAWLRLGIEIVGATVIAIDIALAIVGFVREARSRDGGEFIPIRHTLGRYLTLALDFQLASDILSTAVASMWTQIGQLGAIAVIPTTLNFLPRARAARGARGGEARADGGR